MTINVDIGGGQIVEFPDVETAQQYMNAQQQQDVERFGERGSFERLAAQTGVGSQLGIASVLGLPVDAIAGALSGIGEATGLYGPIEAPVGGSEFFSSLMEPIRQNVPDPTTRGERIARRVGEEVGAAAAGFPLAFAAPAVRAAPVVSAAGEGLSAAGLGGAAARGAASLSGAARAAPARLAAVEGAAAVGAGLGAGALQEAFPESTAANILGALGGGLTVGGAASRLSGAGGRAASILPQQSQREIAGDLYSQVRADRTILPREATEALGQKLSDRMAKEEIDPDLTTGATNVLRTIMRRIGQPMRVEDVERLRRITTKSMPKSASDEDWRLANIMRQEITDFLDNLGDPTADILREGRNAYRRASAAEDIRKLADAAQRRAATTGSGGNTINALRQNLNRVLDNPSLRSSFTDQELSVIRQVVEGSTDQNLLRFLSRMAPTSGNLMSIISMGSAAANPLLAIPFIGAQAAKMAGERSTQRSVQGLLEQLDPSTRVLQSREVGAGDISRGLLGLRTIANQ